LLIPVRFYAPWCGHCKNLKPAYEKAAKSLDGLAQVAAVNCDEESNKAFCGSMGVKGFPTLKTIRPTGSKGKPIITDYQGERSAKAIVDAVKGMIPNHVTKVSDKDLDKWLKGNNASAKAILFSNKGTTSALIKVLAVEYIGNMQVAQIRDKETAAVSTFGIKTYPTFLVLPGGTADPVIYDGPMEKKPMGAFLAQYALSSTDSKGPDPKPAGSEDTKQKPMKDKAASSSDSSTFSAASAAHASSEAAESAATGTTIILESGSEATASPDPNVVPSDAPAPVELPIAPPLPSLTSQSELRAQCLGPKTPTCILALLPPGEDLPSTEALASLAEISEKHKVRGSHLFPFFAVPASNEGASALRSELGLKDGVQLVAVNGRREWYKKFATDKGYGLVEVEGWVDGIRLGEGKKEKLPAGLVVEQTVESATSAAAETASAATESVKSAASKASRYASEKASGAAEAASDATEAVKGKAAQATDAAADATEAAAETASQLTETGKATISSMTVVVGESAASASEKASSAASTASDAASASAGSATSKVSSAASAASEAVSESASSASSKASLAASVATSNVADSAASASHKASSAASVASENVAETAATASDKASSAASVVSEKVAKTAGSVKSKIAEALENAAAKVSAKASSVKHEEL
jgi:protein disulfide-isomerase A6